MIEVEATTRKWGNSLGVILPKDVVQHEHLKENQKIKLWLPPQKKVDLSPLFGILKTNKSGQEIKDEIRKELHGIE
ncbi:MAG TPA: hypothetical protein VJI15_04625 [Candidatus Nanoarchaeia archaeon]|nr:hypothetical protein [Candidatus Nanoarchaeia archaeon]